MAGPHLAPNLGPDVWLPAAHPAAPGRVIGLGELARMDVIHGPRRSSAAIYDTWLAVMRAASHVS